jgi:hypothetical protein
MPVFDDFRCCLWHVVDLYGSGAKMSDEGISCAVCDAKAPDFLPVFPAAMQSENTRVMPGVSR